MGCVSAKRLTPEQEEALKISKEIDQDIRTSKKERPNREIKILLLGGGETGKSTICRQLRFLHLKAFSTNAELLAYKAIVHVNILECMNVMVHILKNNGVRTKLSTCDTASEGTDLYNYTLSDLLELNDQFWKFIKENNMDRTAARYLPDSVGYWFKNLPRITGIDYIPTKDDCFHVRQKTTGIIEVEFSMCDMPFKLIDVGGQTSERRKWINAFDNVTSVIFCVSLIEYDQFMSENGVKNRLEDSLELFEQTCNSTWFSKSSIILFLNKMDLFKKRIVKSPLSDKFSNYSKSDDDNITVALKYMEDLFNKRNKVGKPLYIHATCATDTENVKFIFDSVKDTVVRLFTDMCGY